MKLKQIMQVTGDDPGFSKSRRRGALILLQFY